MSLWYVVHLGLYLRGDWWLAIGDQSLLVRSILTVRLFRGNLSGAVGPARRPMLVRRVVRTFTAADGALVTAVFSPYYIGIPSCYGLAKVYADG